MKCVTDLLGTHDSSHADRQSHGGDLGEVVSKETGVGYDGVLGQRFHSGPGNQAGARLVERYVAVRADTCREITSGDSAERPLIK